MKPEEKFLKLRVHAEALLSQDESILKENLIRNIEELAEELSIYQIELELQTKELQQANVRLATERERFLDLYMNAPVPYMTLNKTGNILQINYAASELLDLPNHQFKFTSIFPYLEDNSKLKFARYFKQLFDSKDTKVEDIIFNNNRNEFIHTNITAVSYYDEEQKETLIRLTIAQKSALKDYNPEKQFSSTVNIIQKRYKAIFSAAGAAIGVISKDGRIIDCNDALLNLLEYNRDELPGKYVNDIAHSDDVQEGEYAEKLDPEKGNSQIRFEKRYITKSGRVIWADVTLSPVKEQDEIIYYVALIIDITKRKLFKEKLQESEQKYRNFAENIAQGIYSVSSEGKFTGMNSVMCKMFGYDKEEELIGKEAWSLAVPEKRKEVRKTFIQRVKNRDLTPVRTQCIRKDGSQFTAEIILNSIIEHNYQFGTVSDITERERTRKALKESEALLELFFNESHEGFFFMMLDEPVAWNHSVDKNKTLELVFKTQRVTKINDAMLSQYRAKREDFIGLTPRDFFAHDLAHGKDVWRKFFDEGKLHIDTNEKRFDGTDMIVTGDYICLYDEQGRITGHFGVQRDVTEQRAAEAALKESEEKYRILSENTSDSVTLYEQNVLKYVSPTFMKNLGYTKTDFKELSLEQIMQFIHPDDRERITKTIAKAYEDKKNEFRQQYRILKKDGSYIWVEDLANVEYDEKSKPFRSIVRTRNISEQKEAELIIKNQNRELQTLNSEKDKFFNIIAHDLKSPFNTILGFSSLLAKNVDRYDSEKISTIAEALNRTAQNTFKLTENLLEWARAQRGKTKFEPKTNNINTLVNETIHLHEKQAADKNITLITRLDDEYVFEFDNNMIMAVLRNLISNAIKFTKEGGQVETSLSADSEFISLRISDTGIGMDDKTLARIFSLGESESRPGTHGEKGTGFGLLICKEFVEKHRGRIHAESKPGEGSTFIVELPYIK